MPKNYQIGDTNYVFPDKMSDADIQAALQPALPKSSGIGKTGVRLKGNPEPGVFGKYIAPTATAIMMGGPILGEAAGVVGLASAGRAAKGGAAAAGGAAEGFGESMSSVQGIRAKLGNIGEALGRAVDKAKLRAQQATNPPRPAPAWKGMPSSESTGLPEVNPIKQTMTPSGRSPVKGPQIAAGPNKPAAPTPRQPIWKGLTDKPEVPKPSPKAELKPPSAETPQSGVKFEPNAAKREAVARNTALAKVLHEGGITSKQATSEMDAEHWKFLAEQMGLKVPAKNQIPEIIKQIEQLEQAAPIAAKPPIPSPAHKLNPPEGPGG